MKDIWKDAEKAILNRLVKRSTEYQISPEDIEFLKLCREREKENERGMYSISDELSRTIQEMNDTVSAMLSSLTRQELVEDVQTRKKDGLGVITEEYDNYRKQLSESYKEADKHAREYLERMKVERAKERMNDKDKRKDDEPENKESLSKSQKECRSVDLDRRMGDINGGL